MSGNDFAIPAWLISYDMRDEEKWRYVLLRYHCERGDGVYSGDGATFFRDFGIGSNAVDTALQPFVERGLIQVSVIGTLNYATLIDTRIWTMDIVEPVIASGEQREEVWKK